MKDGLRIIRVLARIREAETSGKPLISNQGQALDGYSALANYQGVADDAVTFVKEGRDLKELIDCPICGYSFKTPLCYGQYMLPLGRVYIDCPACTGGYVVVVSVDKNGDLTINWPEPQVQCESL